MKLTLFRSDTETQEFLEREFNKLASIIDIEYTDKISSNTGVLPKLEDGEIVVFGGSVISYLTSLKSTTLNEFSRVKNELEEGEEIPKIKQQLITQATVMTVQKLSELGISIDFGQKSIFEVLSGLETEDERANKLIKELDSYKTSTNRKRNKDSLKPYEIPDLD